MEHKPIFVKIDQYEELTKTLATVDSKVAEASKLLSQLQQLKMEEDKQLTAWTAALDQVKTHAVELHDALQTK